jgi:ketol-acid reductoisomerase
MYDRISVTARYGGKLAEDKIINSETKRAMAKLLDEIENGGFVRKLMAQSNGPDKADSHSKKNKFRGQIDRLARYFDSLSGE